MSYWILTLLIFFLEPVPARADRYCLFTDAMINKINLGHPIIDHIYINIRKVNCETSGKEYTHVCGRRLVSEEYRYPIFSL